MTGGKPPSVMTKVLVPANRSKQFRSPQLFLAREPGHYRGRIPGKQGYNPAASISLQMQAGNKWLRFVWLVLLISSSLWPG